MSGLLELDRDIQFGATLQVIAPGAVKVVTGEGMPMFRNPYERGNLFIKFDVKFPVNHFADEATIKVYQWHTPKNVNRNKKDYQ